MHPTQIRGVAGVPETVLGPAPCATRLATLARDAPPAPWELACEAVVWFGRGGGSAAAALPPVLRSSRALAVVGAMVRYRDTPVGPYDEVVGLVASHDGPSPWGHVAFMGVDSDESLVGGRVNWAVPKTCATFTGDETDGRTASAPDGHPLGWRDRVTARALGPRVPLRGRVLVRQLFPGGRIGDSWLTGRCTARLAVVEVHVESDGPLATWLRPGRHLGALLDPAQGTLSPARRR